LCGYNISFICAIVFCGYVTDCSPCDDTIGGSGVGNTGSLLKIYFTVSRIKHTHTRYWYKYLNKINSVRDVKIPGDMNVSFSIYKLLLDRELWIPLQTETIDLNHSSHRFIFSKIGWDWCHIGFKVIWFGRIEKLKESHVMNLWALIMHVSQIREEKSCFFLLRFFVLSILFF
jgi:hypothetical protein